MIHPKVPDGLGFSFSSDFRLPNLHVRSLVQRVGLAPLSLLASIIPRGDSNLQSPKQLRGDAQIMCLCVCVGLSTYFTCWINITLEKTQELASSPTNVMVNIKPAVLVDFTATRATFKQLISYEYNICHQLIDIHIYIYTYIHTYIHIFIHIMSK